MANDKNHRPTIRTRRWAGTQLDWNRVLLTAAQMTGGQYHPPAAKVADAILEECRLVATVLHC